ncbi:branched-chain-amino-acid transaminase [Rheinheimera sp. WS51]|uniref:branched-chain-amino-acid transaminase n=1 Tax=Rheinheimera sp. WS51 TaxID=3425886 RepID=UPI003D8F8312
MSLNKPKYAWLNGEKVAWDNCVVHVRTQGAFWGANVFEGVRGYWNAQQQQIFMYRIQEHIDRLRGSMKCVDMPVTYTDEEIIEASVGLLQANEYQEDVHIVIAPYFAMGPNFDPLCHTEDTGMHITAIPMPRSPKYDSGAAATVSTWRRISDDSMPPRIKTGANYHNSRLAQHEAVRNGFDTALFLNQRGTISEGPGSCLMMFNRGVLTTPPGTSGVLEGITVDSVAQIAMQQMGLKFERREIDRTELYTAEEVFTVGTLSEITPLISVDRKVIGNGQRGPIVQELQRLYELEVRLEPKAQLSTPIYYKGL